MASRLLELGEKVTTEIFNCNIAILRSTNNSVHSKAFHKKKEAKTNSYLSIFLINNYKT